MNPRTGWTLRAPARFRHLIRQLAAEGATVFLSSHLLSEIEQVCSHVGIMNRGKLLMQGTLDDLKASASPKLRVEADDPVRAAEVLAGMGMADVAVQGPQIVGSLDGLRPRTAAGPWSRRVSGYGCCSGSSYRSRTPLSR